MGPRDNDSGLRIHSEASPNHRFSKLQANVGKDCQRVDGQEISNPPQNAQRVDL